MQETIELKRADYPTPETFWAQVMSYVRQGYTTQVENNPGLFEQSIVLTRSRNDSGQTLIREVHP